MFQVICCFKSLHSDSTTVPLEKVNKSVGLKKHLVANLVLYKSLMWLHCELLVRILFKHLPRLITVKKKIRHYRSQSNRRQDTFKVCSTELKVM